MNTEELDMVAKAVRNKACLDQLPEFYAKWQASGEPLLAFCKEAYEEYEAWGNMYAQRKLTPDEIEYIFTYVCKTTLD